MPNENGRLIIISGPSGAGKSTVVQQLLAECELPLALSISATTRAPRPGEQDGREYYFLTQEEFKKRREKGDFLECKEVFGQGYWYGTLAKAVSTGLSEGKWVILEIDVQGALSVLKTHPKALTFFVHPGSIEELERRLRNRRTESEEAIQRRLHVAEEEMALRHHYTHEVINNTVDNTVQQLCTLLAQYQGENVPCSKN